MARDMQEKFRRFGDIHEVVIHSRADVCGRRYGFVRFFGASDAQTLATKMDNIFLWNTKIFANTPIFERKEGCVEKKGPNRRASGFLDKGKEKETMLAMLDVIKCCRVFLRQCPQEI